MDTWLLRYDGFDPEGEGLRESLCALGNGRFATRAAAPESQADGVHYPGTYAAGVFNRLTDTVDDHRVEHESNVNLPDWQSLRFRAADSDWVAMRSADVRDYVQELDLRRGLLLRRFTVADPAGRRTTVAQRRFVSMADPFLAALENTFVAENWSGPLVVRSGVDGRVTNSGVLRYEGLGAV
ncbi:MAG TPA: glycoside hydrolase family 65 protein, partial [Actinomycetes bacterium]|nr:glycoside hydrolase family 65 protein [Actinomycetes bacterium]